MPSEAAKNQQFPCSSCGGQLEFSPKTGRLECLYCGQEKQIALSGAVTEQAYEAFLATNPTQIAALSTTAQEVECPGCRAQFTFEPPTIAGPCPFCGTSIVAHPQDADSIVTPAAVLPFGVDQEAAKDKIQRWLHRRWFAPTGLHKLSQQEKLQGIYLPFWTYDCQTLSHYRGERGDHYTVTENYTETNSEGQVETKTRSVQKTRWSSVSRQVQRYFDDVLVAGTEAVHGQHLKAITNWDLSHLKPYTSSYLAGFKAQRYQVSLQAGFEQAKEQMSEQIRSDVRRDIGGDEQRIHSVSTSYSQISFKPILLPVWVSSYHFKNRQYSVMVNAQTGKVAGDRPFSSVKISLAVLAVITIVAGAFGVKTYLDHSTAHPPVLPSPIESLPAQPDRRSQELPPTSPQPPISSSPSVADQSFRQAVGLAQTAVSLGQQAQNPQDWRQIVRLWEQAITLMSQVPPSSRNYAVAKQRTVEYQRYLNYAKQQAN